MRTDPLTVKEILEMPIEEIIKRPEFAKLELSHIAGNRYWIISFFGIPSGINYIYGEYIFPTKLFLIHKPI